MQFRYIWNSREDTSPSSIDKDEFGFHLRRVKLAFDGQIGSPRITYAVGLQTDSDDETIYLDHAYFGYKLMDGMTLYGGEGKGPFLREELTSSKRQLAMERSLVNEVFTTGRIQGVWVKIDADDYTVVKLAISDGANSGEAGGTKDFHHDATDIAFTGRIDVRLAGEWSQKKDFTAWSGEESAVFVGAAVHYEIGETGDGQASALLPAMSNFNPTAGTVGYDEFVSWTIDGSVESEGVNIFAAFTGHHINVLGGVSDVDAYGLVVQGGVMVIPDKLEPFVRWEWIDPDKSHQVNLVTFGANYYLNKHNAKFTADLVWALNSLDNLSKSSLGLLGDTTGRKGPSRHARSSSSCCSRLL